MSQVVSIHIYPIKGMQGVAVSSGITLERGLQNDRRYMLVDKKNTFISQRSHPQLVFFFPRISDDRIHVSYKEDSIEIDLSTSKDKTVEATLFDKTVRGTEVSEEANQWFSQRLGEEVRLIKMNPGDVRYKKLIRGPERVEVSFADGYPYLIVGTASLDLLNSKLENSLAMHRFRPNIVVQTEEAHIEDSWKEIRIGGVEFSVIKACARCPVVTVDQETAVRSKEPLKTLATYRKMDNKVYFGANAISLKEGSIHIGDEVVVL